MGNKQQSPAPSIAAQTRYWDQHWRRTQPPTQATNHCSDAILALAHQLNLDQPRILDLGCGTGSTSRMLDVLGPTEGVDLSPVAIELAREENPAMTLRTGDLFSMDLGSSVFDLVVCQEVIAHVANPAELMDRIADALRPLGHLIITAANQWVVAPTATPTSPTGVVRRLRGRELTAIVRTRFDLLASTRVPPGGPRGFLRVLKSRRLRGLLARLTAPLHPRALEARPDRGHTVIVLARKPAPSSL